MARYVVSFYESPGLVIEKKRVRLFRSVTYFMLIELQAVKLLTRCLNGDLLPSGDERGLLLLQLGRHLHDLGYTSRAVQVNST